MTYVHRFIALLAMFLMGCSTGAELRGKAQHLVELTEKIHDRAYVCTPKELAKSKAHTEFAEYELKQGNFVRAKEHLITAESNAMQADKGSTGERCVDASVQIEYDKSAVVDLTAKPDDQDGDGLIDTEDACPMDPEDVDGFEDTDGCPDHDNDKDGIEDRADRCPYVSEGPIDGFEDDDGCPDFDNDGDSIVDINDQCPLKPEDIDRFQDDDGCPDHDNDNDEITDFLDECTLEKEIYNGYLDEDGCPDEQPLAQIKGDQIQLNQKVFFKTAKAQILPQSFQLLDEVAEILTENSGLTIRVEGHTDSRGSDKYNRKLSQARAKSVSDYLTDKGVGSDRIAAVGFGEDKPIEDNSTEAGRAANRRVEIHITSR
jgi:OmpA-OmpF porin, OOP family